MAYCKPCVKSTLLAGVLWMANELPDAHGQTSKQLPVSPRPSSAELVQRFVAVSSTQVARSTPAFNFAIAPDTPIQELLPIPPKAKLAAPRLIDDIAQVPEVAFQEPLARSPEALKLTAHTMAKINHLNRQKTDGFIEALLQARPDLAGLPMAMGDTCRTKGDRTH
jgi:hypothetical protein